MLQCKANPHCVIGSSGNIRPRDPTTSPRGPQNRVNSQTGRPQQRVNNAPRNRAHRGVDARSLGAPQAGGQPANIIRAPRFRGPRISRPTGGRKPMKSGANNKKGPRRNAWKKEPEEEEGDDLRLQEVNDVYRALAEERKPVPVRYDPQHPDFSTLKDTWPALPTDPIARAAGVSEKLSWLSDRFPNGYEPPYELGKRLFDGKSVSFSSEEEKTQAVEEAKKLAQQQADKLTQEKGDLVDPVDISFEPINAEHKKSLLVTQVQGDYSEWTRMPSDKPPIFGGIMTTLRNNVTYQTPGKSSQFLTKVESLLSSKRPSAPKRG